MGMFDEIRWDAALPEGHPPGDRIFQTKSLNPCPTIILLLRKGGYCWWATDGRMKTLSVRRT